MEKTTVLGMNRTGIDMSPIDIKEMLAFTNVTPPSPKGTKCQWPRCGGNILLKPRNWAPFLRQATLKGVASTAMQKLTGKNPEACIDRLGCWLAFERTGVRLYDALIAKCSSAPGGDTGCSRRHVMDLS